MTALLSVDQSDHMSSALSKLKALVFTMNSACFGDMVELSELTWLFMYAFEELDIIEKVFRELDGDRAERRDV